MNKDCVSAQQIIDSDQLEEIGDEQFCRICLLGSDGSQLITPCKCIGKYKYVHEKCMQSWLTSAAGQGLVEGDD